MASSKIPKIPKWEYVDNVYWWQNSWTCPADGIAIAEMVTNTSGQKAYWYIQDTNTAQQLAKMNQTADGTSQTIMFPVIKGHIYNTSAISAIQYAYVYYFKLN